MKIEIRNLTKRFGAFTALDNVNLEIESGELLALLGPSGCGKTTLLRILSGLEFADEGQILFDGEDATSQNVRARRVGFVFQHYALFRHMTVFENVAFGLRVRQANRPTNDAIRTRVEELLQLIRLEGLAQRYPAQLSGGQRQRVALARALAVEPRVLLLDEPFGALDAKVRQELRRWLRRLHDAVHITSVFVTHDQEEALEVADRVVVLNKGRIEQSGTPAEVYDRPANPFVYEFLGNVNLFRGRAAGPVGYVRPHDIEISRVATGEQTLPAKVSAIHPVGGSVRVDLEITVDGQRIEAEIRRDQFLHLALQPGDAVFITPHNVRVFAPEI